MNQSPCPMCGKNSLTEKHGEYRFEPPDAIPGGAIVVPDATWYECGACHEQVVPPALENAIERERYRRLGLLTPEEIKAVRERTGLSAVDMATLLSVGEKTYTRWENGRSLQNKWDNDQDAYDKNVAAERAHAEKLRFFSWRWFYADAMLAAREGQVKP